MFSLPTYLKKIRLMHICTLYIVWLGRLVGWYSVNTKSPLFKVALDFLDLACFYDLPFFYPFHFLMTITRVWWDLSGTDKLYVSPLFSSSVTHHIHLFVFPTFLNWANDKRWRERKLSPNIGNILVDAEHAYDLKVTLILECGFVNRCELQYRL